MHYRRNSIALLLRAGERSDHEKLVARFFEVVFLFFPKQRRTERPKCFAKLYARVNNIFVLRAIRAHQNRSRSKSPWSAFHSPLKPGDNFVIGELLCRELLDIVDAAIIDVAELERFLDLVGCI